MSEHDKTSSDAITTGFIFLLVVVMVLFFTQRSDWKKIIDLQRRVAELEQRR